MKRFLAGLVLLLAVPCSFGAGFDFRTTGTTTSEVWNFRGRTAAPTVADPDWGKLYYDKVTQQFKISQNGGVWANLFTQGVAGVASFNGRAGAVVAGAGDYTATQITNTPAGGIAATNAQAAINELDTEKETVANVALKAPLASPALTGVPTAPTAANGTNTTQLATTAFVQGKTAAQTPSTATGDVAATDVQAAIAELASEKETVANVALKAPLASPALTGNPTSPTPAAADNDTSIATTAFVQSESLNSSEADALFLTPAEGNAAYAETATGNTFTGNQTINGDVGIGGTSSAGRQLEVTSGTNTVHRINTSSAGAVGAFTEYTRAGVQKFVAGLGPVSGTDKYELGVGATAFLTIDSTGKVGIGTQGPASPFHLSAATTGASGYTSRFVDSNSNIGASVLIGATVLGVDEKYKALFVDSGGLNFGKVVDALNAAPVGQMVIKTNGNVGVGIAPLARLHVGTAGTGTNTEEIRIDSGSGAGADSILSLRRNGVYLGQIAISGAANNSIIGAAIDDLNIRSSQKINFSADQGTTRHLQIASTGALTTSSSITERNRPAPMGEWISFTPTLVAQAGTWTGTCQTTKYSLAGKTMSLNFVCRNTSVSATPSFLSFTVPGGFVSANEVAGYLVIKQGTTGYSGSFWIGAGGTTIYLYAVLEPYVTGTNFLTTTSTTNVSFMAQFEIQSILLLFFVSRRRRKAINQSIERMAA